MVIFEEFKPTTTLRPNIKFTASSIEILVSNCPFKIELES